MLRYEYRIEWADDLRKAGVSLSFLDLYREHIEWMREAPYAQIRDYITCALKPFFLHQTTSKTDIHSVNVYLRRTFEMARGKKKPANAKQNRTEIEFVTIRLSDDDKSILAEAEEMTGDEFKEFVDTLVLDGYKLSVALQDNGSVNFTATCRDEGNSNHGMALSGWGDSVITACMSFRYKHLDLAGGDWVSVSGSSPNTSKFG